MFHLPDVTSLFPSFQSEHRAQGIWFLVLVVVVVIAIIANIYRLFNPIAILKDRCCHYLHFIGRKTQAQMLSAEDTWEPLPLITRLPRISLVNEREDESEWTRSNQPLYLAHPK